jgi:NADPH-dependent 2,4-dienoyl-CoA reductase/sulfur reductase-like enzyme/rhodanese-related sulfurtransferase
MTAKRILIVGGVAGGASCAARLRRMDEQAEIFLFERGPDISFANCGLPYYIGGAIEDRKQLLMATPERFRDVFRVEVRAGSEVQRIDRDKKTIEIRNVQTAAVETQSYDVLVLSTGAAPVRPPLPGIDLPGIFTLRSLQDADRIRHWILHRKFEHAIVVGAGYIGLEMVENLSRRRMNVTLLERCDQVMPPMDPEMVSPVHDELRRQGIDLQLHNGAAAFEPSPRDTITVTTQDNQRFTAGLVVLAIGVKPDVALAQQAGLKLGPLGGICVDDQMRTSDPAIFAVGDAVEVRDFVTGRPALIPLAGPANRQGRIVADVIYGRDAHYRGSQGTAVIGCFDLTLAMTGATEKVLRREGIAHKKSYTHSAHHAGYYPGAERISLKLLFEPGTGRILGAQAVGRSGVDKRIDVLALAIQIGATVFDLEEAELAYAPQYGSAKDPVNIASFVAGNILRGDVEPAFWSEWQSLPATGGHAPLVLDVRHPLEVAAGGVPGALNIPLGELRRRLGELPRDREILVFCGVGQRAYFASRILMQSGFHARNISGGIATWKMQVGSSG